MLRACAPPTAILASRAELAAELTDLLAALAPGAVGAQVTVFDPDLDPDGRYAVLLTGILTAVTLR